MQQCDVYVSDLAMRVAASAIRPFFLSKWLIAAVYKLSSSGFLLLIYHTPKLLIFMQFSLFGLLKQRCGVDDLDLDPAAFEGR